MGHGLQLFRKVEGGQMGGGDWGGALTMSLPSPFLNISLNSFSNGLVSAAVQAVAARPTVLDAVLAGFASE